MQQLKTKISCLACPTSSVHLILFLLLVTCEFSGVHPFWICHCGALSFV